jgi:hypothetical protein
MGGLRTLSVLLVAVGALALAAPAGAQTLVCPASGLCIPTPLDDAKGRELVEATDRLCDALGERRVANGGAELLVLCSRVVSANPYFSAYDYVRIPGSGLGSYEVHDRGCPATEVRGYELFTLLLPSIELTRSTTLGC